MIASNSRLQGIIRGKTVELDRDSGLPDGARVLVVVSPAKSAGTDGLLRAFGAWADAGDDLDEFLAQVRHDRKASRREIDP